VKIDKPAVVFVIQHYPPFLGGAEKQARGLSRQLAKQLGEVHLLTTRFQRSLAKRQLDAGVTIRRLPTVGFKPLKFVLNFLCAWLYMLVRGGRYQVVHAHCLSAFTLGAMLAGRLRGARTLVKVCSVGRQGDIARIKQFPFGRLLWSLTLKFDVFIAQTEDMATVLCREGVCASKIEVAVNAILPDSIGTADSIDRSVARRRLSLPDVTTILYVGRLGAGKNLDILMQVWPQIIASHQVKLVIVGDGPEASRLDHWRKSLPEPDSVLLTGYQKNVEHWYRAADIFVFPSRSEAFGTVIIEAMTYSLATVTTRVGIVRDWSDAAGFLKIFDCDEPESLISALTELIEDPDMTEQLGLRARQYINGLYGVDQIARRYCEIYARLYDNRRGGKAG
jgi:glycosyltransferase involved in cell wall biosynthesis